MTARDRTMAIGLAIVGIVVAGWFLVLAPMRKEASSLSTQIAAQRDARDAALADLAAGTGARRQYARDYATVARLGAAIPEDDNVASLIVQIEQAADATASDFRALKVGDTSGAATPAPAPPTTGSAPATQTAAATLPPGASVGPAGFPTMPFNFRFTGDFFRLSDFVERLQRFLVVRGDQLAIGGRFMTIDGIALNAAPGGFPRMLASVAATTYLLPGAEGLTDGATPDSPAGAASGGASGAPDTDTASNGPSPVTATATPVTP